MSFSWIPNKEIMDLDSHEFDERIRVNRQNLLEDHSNAGLHWPIWIKDIQFVKQLLNDIRSWVETHDGLISHELWSGTNLVSFKTRDNALMFKLMFGGES